MADALFNLNTKITETYRKEIMSAIGLEICLFYGRKKVHKVMTIHVRSKKNVSINKLPLRRRYACIISWARMEPVSNLCSHYINEKLRSKKTYLAMLQTQEHHKFMVH